MRGWRVSWELAASWSPSEGPISGPWSHSQQVLPRSTIPGVISSRGIGIIGSSMRAIGLFRAHYEPQRPRKFASCPWTCRSLIELDIPQDRHDHDDYADNVKDVHDCFPCTWRRTLSAHLSTIA